MRTSDLKLIKKAGFFLDFNWEELINFKMKAPYTPEIKTYSQNLGNFSNNNIDKSLIAHLSVIIKFFNILYSDKQKRNIIVWMKILRINII